MSVQFGNVYGPQPTGYTTGAAPMGAPTAQTTGYAPDSFAARYMSATGTSIQLPVAAIVDDAAVASRYNFCFMKSSEALLKVGGDGGSFGRFFLNVLAGAVPLLTPASKRAEISAKVLSWVGRADLVRSGCSATDARLLQSAGIFNISDLARMASPMDQATLAGRLAMSAYQFGYPPPTPAAVASWVATAQTLPVRVK
jgi:hypothetical protein